MFKDDATLQLAVDRYLQTPASPFQAKESTQDFKKPGRVVLEHLSQSTRGKGAIREGKLVVWTHTIAEIVRHTRPVGPIDFAARDLVYDIACEASIMGAIPQAILRPQRKACSHRRPSMHDVW